MIRWLPHLEPVCAAWARVHVAAVPTFAETAPGAQRNAPRQKLEEATPAVLRPTASGSAEALRCLGGISTASARECETASSRMRVEPSRLTGPAGLSK